MIRPLPFLHPTCPCSDPLLSDFPQDVQTLRSRILEVDQQLRTVSQPAHVARDRDAALAEQEVSRAAGDCRRRRLPAVAVVVVVTVVVVVVECQVMSLLAAA